jgi:hypothetical protein
MATWRADFFDNWDDTLPSRSVTICADDENDAVDKAAAQMGSMARIEFTRSSLGKIKPLSISNSDT